MTESKGNQTETAVESGLSKQIPAVAIPLSKHIKINNQFFTSTYQESSDVIIRTIYVEKREAIIIYIEGLTDTQKLDEQVLETLLKKTLQSSQRITNIIISCQR